MMLDMVDLMPSSNIISRAVYSPRVPLPLDPSDQTLSPLLVPTAVYGVPSHPRGRQQPPCRSMPLLLISFLIRRMKAGIMVGKHTMYTDCSPFSTPHSMRNICATIRIGITDAIHPHNVCNHAFG